VPEKWNNRLNDYFNLQFINIAIIVWFRLQLGNIFRGLMKYPG